MANAKIAAKLTDNWRHRSTLMRCATCMWYMPKEPHNKTTKQELGRCKRHAPTLNGFPVVFCADWCGDHKLDENKFQEEED